MRPVGPRCGLCAGPVPDGEVVAGFEQPHRHGGAHLPEAEERKLGHVRRHIPSGCGPHTGTALVRIASISARSSGDRSRSAPATVSVS
jgi:hypothetical protein